MRTNGKPNAFGICCIVITFFLAITGAVVSIAATITSDPTIVGIGFSAMLAAIWMLWKNRPIVKL